MLLRTSNTGPIKYAHTLGHTISKTESSKSPYDVNLNRVLIAGQLALNKVNGLYHDTD